MDIVYQARQQGVHLEALEVMDTVTLQVLHRQLGFTYLLIPRIILQNENRLSDQPGLMTDISAHKYHSMDMHCAFTRFSMGD